MVTTLYTGEFLRRHSSGWRLTDVGRQQAECAGQWLKDNFYEKDFDRFYVSEYIRCMETAARLYIPNARWFAEVFLRERDWGQMDLMSWAERQSKMADELKLGIWIAFYAHQVEKAWLMLLYV